MKTIKYVFFFILISFIFYNCQNPTKEQFGETLIYMPQAIVQSGGVNNNYNVIIKMSENNDTIIPVGVYRSGLHFLSDMNIELEIATDTLVKAISLSEIETFKDFRKVAILPIEYYTFSNKVFLKEKQRENWTNLYINKNKLITNWETGIDKYILPIKIRNSNDCLINEKLSLTMFVIQKK